MLGGEGSMYLLPRTKILVLSVCVIYMVVGGPIRQGYDEDLLRNAVLGGWPLVTICPLAGLLFLKSG